MPPVRLVREPYSVRYYKSVFDVSVRKAGFALVKGRKIKSNTGNTTAANMPYFRLSPKRPEAMPTVVGPREQPISPPRASSANKSVPPLFSFAAEILKVPGHKIPTESPQRPHPIRPSAGEGDREIKR